MDFIHQDSDTILLNEIFNQEHGSMIFEQKLLLKPTFKAVVFKNVGIKIMRDAMDKFQDQGVTEVELYYNWNYIMMMPKLVCYDKNKWTTMQQLTNWNREWNQLFIPCYSLQQIKIDLVCSWMDQQFVKALLDGLNRIPNLRKVQIKCSSKNQNVQQILEACKKAGIFKQFDYKFEKYTA